MADSTIRDSKIPCPNCKKGTLFWQPDEKIYVCTKCGVQEEALKTWIGAAEHREKKKVRKRQKDRQWALDILGLKDELKTPNKSNQERLWDDIESLIKSKEKDSNKD